jgi:membrane protein DedA with SNARE-associated domain
VSSAGYPGLAGLILVENLFPPIPSEVILPLAGFYVSTGQFAFVWAVIAATAGSLVGALVIHGLARRSGRPLLLRYGRLLRIREADLDRSDEWFDRFGGWLVLGDRMVPGARSLVSVPAGLSEMPVGRFALLTTIGSAVWNAALIGAGSALGDNYEKVGDVVGPISTILNVSLILLLTGVGIWWFRRRRRDS